ncbi:MAG TPA: efflux RND transporter periplasmic adaptor subunit [Geothrix sp.]|uniref:efflux RND transporter periplasmic adaptor subunit n=1 Tax=Geothrix mesophila TaxID=2922723 RepID=UPI001FADB000|nr:efflux RND transporter periplasmic adaptor subunit [Geothrix sp. SG198]HJV38080.1 efflux RND transporter periplasmic adaptor subunit [Geothrix sp.]
MRPTDRHLPIAMMVLLGGAAFLATGCGNHPESRLKLSGNIEVIQVEASFRVAGKVIERPVDEGQMVQAGQLLARLDARDLEQQVAMRRADAATTRAALDALLAGSRKEEIAASKAALEQAQADLKRLEPDEARIRDLQQKGILSVRDYEASRAALEAARGKVQQADQQYTLVRKGPRKEDIDQARARYDQAQQALALAQTQLGYATLTAPSAGVILSKNVEPMEYVSPGTAVVTMADLGQVWLRAYVEETDLGRVKVGQKAFVTSDSFPGKRYEGRVAFIASEAEFTPKTVQTRKERTKLVYRIKIDIPNPAMELKPGMPVDAEIALDGR